MVLYCLVLKRAQAGCGSTSWFSQKSKHCIIKCYLAKTCYANEMTSFQDALFSPSMQWTKGMSYLVWEQTVTIELGQSFKVIIGSSHIKYNVLFAILHNLHIGRSTWKSNVLSCHYLYGYIEQCIEHFVGSNFVLKNGEFAYS